MNTFSSVCTTYLLTREIHIVCSWFNKRNTVPHACRGVYYSVAQNGVRVMPKSLSLPVSSSYTHPWTRTSFFFAQACWMMSVWTMFSTCCLTDART